MRAVFILAPLVLLPPMLAMPPQVAPAPDEAGQEAGPSPELVARGESVYELVCAGCHTLDPPPDSAPPLRHVARHLRQELETFEDFAHHVRTYVPAPSPEASRLPPMAIERFGLMDPLPLTEDVLTAAAAYVWSLADADDAMGPGGGMRHRHGMSRDTVATGGGGPGPHSGGGS